MRNMLPVSISAVAAKSQFTETEYVDIADAELPSSYPIGDDVSAFIRCVAAPGRLASTKERDVNLREITFRSKEDLSGFPKAQVTQIEARFCDAPDPTQPLRVP
jgi:hypothetical protein